MLRKPQKRLKSKNQWRNWQGRLQVAGINLPTRAASPSPSVLLAHPPPQASWATLYTMRLVHPFAHLCTFHDLCRTSHAVPYTLPNSSSHPLTSSLQLHDPSSTQQQPLTCLPETCNFLPVFPLILIVGSWQEIANDCEIWLITTRIADITATKQSGITLQQHH